MSTAGEADTRKVNAEIAKLYDQSSGFWEDLWGDHMHHGFYDPDAKVSTSDHRAAQTRMVEEALRFAGISDDPATRPKTIVDVGCGLGGGSYYLASKLGAKCIGINLSAVQVERCNVLAQKAGVADKASFQVADALEQPFPDGHFDLVYVMETAEHIPGKAKLVNELVRVAAPGGTIIIVSWCHRDLGPSESFEPWEQNLLKKIYKAYHIHDCISTSDYVKLLQSLPVQDIKTADWSDNIAPFWPAVMRSSFTWKGFIALLRSGLHTLKGAFGMPAMIEGYKKGVIKFSIITCRKPE